MGARVAAGGAGQSSFAFSMRRASAGSKGLEHQVRELSAQIMQQTDDWEKRNSALIALQTAVSENSGNLAAFTPEVWRLLKGPLAHTVSDLRSALVRESCVLLEMLAAVVGDAMQPLMREMTPLLLRLVGSANGVIQEYVDHAMVAIIEHVRFPRQLKDIAYEIKTSRSKELRAVLARYILQIVQQWPPEVLERDIDHLQAAITNLLEDASPVARELARGAFAQFQQSWPRRALTVMSSLDGRTQRMLQSPMKEDAGGKSRLAVTTGAMRVRRSSSSQSLHTPPSPSNSAHQGRSQQSMALSTPDVLAQRKTSSQPKDLGRSMSASKADVQGNRLSPVAWIAPAAVGNGLLSPAAEPQEIDTAESVAVSTGDRVMVRTSHGSTSRAGAVKFVGSTQFASGTWVGVQLDSTHGKNDGTVNGVYYFKCPPNTGIFVRPNMVCIIDQVEQSAALALPQSGAEDNADHEHSKHQSEALQLLSHHKTYTKQMLESLEGELALLAHFEAAMHTNLQPFHTQDQQVWFLWTSMLLSLHAHDDICDPGTS
eukprot:TRINITY_DN1758_c0_g1_i3.p1 TRINITY_DN1758_c0_g1~~TRINITY_DN1758_c0_g1_i3.p1  ORF type:complete len:542 (-),score=76.53 TRINITY_DN1758_c0_g1_i3:32-1657(-)